MARSFTLKRQFLEIKDELYEVIDTVPEKQCPESKLLKWKYARNCDTVFKKEGYLFFVRHIPDAIIIQDTIEELKSELEQTVSENDTREDNTINEENIEIEDKINEENIQIGEQN